MEITVVGAAELDAVDGQGGVAAIFQREGLRRTGGVDLLVPQAQTCWTQAHHWCRRRSIS